MEGHDVLVICPIQSRIFFYGNHTFRISMAAITLHVPEIPVKVTSDTQKFLSAHYTVQFKSLTNERQ